MTPKHCEQWGDFRPDLICQGVYLPDINGNEIGFRSISRLMLGVAVVCLSNIISEHELELGQGIAGSWRCIVKSVQLGKIMSYLESELEVPVESNDVGRASGGVIRDL